ncbi:MAG: prephenate dehydratase [Alphaproteobacteria bacterium]|nr:prephenate dehydratase [Alphaproteobacteria bacterium]
MTPPRRVAFQGELGAYSHLACRAACPDHAVMPCPSFDAVFDAVEGGQAELGMLPVENSQAGRVADIHRLLPQRSLHIIGEHYQPVHHQLLGVPGATRAQVREARSHPQALAQCRTYLHRHAIKPVASRDTSGAALDVAALGDPGVAALASTLAGELAGLTVLDADIEDAADNTTRFLVMAESARDPGATAGPLVTSCLFRVRNIPAALYKALGGFATNGVNLHKLESYQLGGFRWAQFAIDFEGHPAVPAVARAMEELRFFSHELRVLGTYPAHPYRFRRPA